MPPRFPDVGANREVQQKTRNITSSRPENRPNFESPHIHIIHVDRSVTNEWRNMHFIAEHHHHGTFDGMNHKQSRSQSSKKFQHILVQSAKTFTKQQIAILYQAQQT